jgi:Ca-activated chloride channel homolog
MVMRKRAFLIGFVILGAMAVAANAQQAQPSVPPPPPPPEQTRQPGTIVRRVSLVDILFSVINRSDKLVTDLSQEDFKIFDNGAQQAITSFSRPTVLPLRIGMVLDTSNSIRSRLKFEQEAATEFLFNALRREKDQAFLMTFDAGPQIIKDFTGDSDVLRDTIFKQRAGGGTALFDAVYEASQQLLNKSPLPPGPNPDVRRVLVVISDGDDNSSNRTRDAAIEMAQRAGVIIYTISSSMEWVDTSEQSNASQRVNRKFQKTGGDHVLEQMARETGGRAFFPYRVDDLGQAFLDIGDELAHQYALAYNPGEGAADGKFHAIRIQVSRKDVTVRARRGYYAIAPPSASSNP